MGLHRAAKACFSVTMESLPSLAANVEMADLTGETLLFEPIRSTVNNYNKHIHALQLLLDAGADQ